MNYPNLSEEKKLWKQRYKFVVGLDEVGRGPLAGSVIAAAVSVSSSIYKVIKLKGINDSKKLSEKQREEFYKILTKHSAISWGIGIVSEKVIDKINILEATKLAMARAIASLISKSQYPISKQIQNPKSKILKPEFLLIDGNFGIDSKIPQKSIIKGDEKVFSISVASIVAKVTRDRLMQKMHKKYPQYGFDKHKGYGTKLHIKNLEKFGPCKIHRKTFDPVRSLDKKEIKF